MKFGLFSNGERGNLIARTTYEEDLAEVVHADTLGMSEAWISEHGTLLSWSLPDTMPSADLFICKAAALTKNIRMGPGIRPLPFFHPVQVATDVAVCDHLTGGRYLAGFGLGIGTGNGQRGELPGDRRVMMNEAIDLILKCWSSPEPFDWDGDIWQGKNWHIIPRPLTQPRPEVGIACSRSEGTLAMAAEKGFLPLMSWNPSTDQIKQMIEMYMDGGNDAMPPRRSRARVARVVYVAESDEQAYKDLENVDIGIPLRTRAPRPLYSRRGHARRPLHAQPGRSPATSSQAAPKRCIKDSRISTTRSAASVRYWSSPAATGARGNSASARGPC